MISFGDGLAILKNWQTQNTDLWLVLVNSPDEAEGPPGVRIKSVSTEPPGFVFGRRSETVVDLRDASFDDALPSGFDASRFAHFLVIDLPGRELLLFAEERP